MTLNREILRLALPNILSNISVPLIASVDTGLMGHLSGLHLAAVGSASMIFNFLYWNFGFLRMGTTGMVAQAYGKKDTPASSKVFFQALILAFSIAILLFSLQGFIGPLATDLMNLEGELKDLALQYFYVRIWDVPATLGLYVIMAWFFGNQNAFIPLVLTVIINVSNIILSVYFVNVLHWSIAGVATGSVIANYLGLICGFILMYFKIPTVQVEVRKLKDGLARFFHVNRDIFIRTVLLSLSFAFLYSQSATFGTVILGINVIILQFLNWMSYAVDGFAYASESMVGKYYGAKDEEKAYQSIKLSFVYGGAFALVFSIIYGFFTMPITSIFTDVETVLSHITEYRIWLILFPILGFASYIWDGVFVGLTASKAMRNTMLVSFIIFIGSYYMVRDWLGYHGLLLALLLYLFSRGLAQTVVFYRKGLKLG